MKQLMPTAITARTSTRQVGRDHVGRNLDRRRVRRSGLRHLVPEHCHHGVARHDVADERRPQITHRHARAVEATYAVQPFVPASECDPNYTVDCVPIASDVDCASGSGNGPAYVPGPVTVVGHDIYDLDRDGNGVGCEN